MATKLKKLRPVAAFIAFVVSVSILIGIAMLGVLVFNDAWDFAPDYRKTRNYQSVIGQLIEGGYSTGIAAQNPGAAIDGDEMSDVDGVSIAKALISERDNIAYVITDETSGQTIATNIPEGRRLVNGEYAHFLQIEGTSFTEWLDGDMQKPTNSGDIWQMGYYFQINSKVRGEIETGGVNDISMLIQVKAPESMGNYGSLHRAWYDWYSAGIFVIVYAVLAGLAVITLLGLLIGRKSLALANQNIAKTLGKLWCEAKLAAAAIIGYGGFELLLFGIWNGSPGYLLLAFGCFWLLWLVAIDLLVNKKRFFTHNSFASLQQFWRGLMSKYAFLARMKRLYTALLCAQLVLLVLLMVVPLVFGRGGSWLFCLGLVLLGAYLLLTYIKRYNQNMDDFEKLIDYTEQVKLGTAEEPPTLSEQSDFAPMCASLREIYGGINAAVERQLRSERMKAELITNVSHDLKTPLTSIINYVDLLSDETLQPEFANDYVKVLAQKSQRLKNLVQDLFDVSKANSGAIDLQVEQLDVVALLEQTTAELEERVTAAGVELKERYAAQRLLVLADGKKLHRVFENLLGNALKYSLGGTRVYITAQGLDGNVQVVFKNIANYEMSFSPDDIIERFQRGDDSRTTEGSGLGLAIAKSFLELCGGQLAVELDGDLFKAIVTLPFAPAAAPAPTPPRQEAPEQRSEPADGCEQSDEAAAQKYMEDAPCDIAAIADAEGQ